MFRGNKIFGIDISDFSIEILQLNSRKKPMAFGRIVIEEGIVRDGFVLKKEELKKKIEKVVSKSRVRGNKVILSLPESKVFTSLFSIPGEIKGDRLKEAIENEARKTIPIESSKIYWDWQVVFTDPKSNQQLILYVGTLKEIIDDYLDIFKDLGIEIIAFELDSVALARALLVKNKPRNGVLIMDIGARVTDISIFDKDIILKDSNVVSVGGDYLTKILAEKLKISEEKAERAKRKFGVDGENEKVSKILKEELEPVIERTNKSVSYYRGKLDGAFLAGGSAQIPGLSSYFASKINLNTSIGVSPLLAQIKEGSVLFNTVAGLALRGIEKDPKKAGVNLLPKKEKRTSLVSQETSKKNYFRVLAIIIGIIGFVFLSWVIYKFIIEPLDQKPKPSPLVEEVPVATGTEEEVQPEPEPEPELEPEVEVEEIEVVIILETEEGWIDVRQGPDDNYPSVARINAGDSFPLLAEFDNWYRIELTDGTTGWVSGKSVIIEKQSTN
jgi:type IV pilus assembly protein PilM